MGEGEDGQLAEEGGLERTSPKKLEPSGKGGGERECKNETSFGAGGNSRGRLVHEGAIHGLQILRCET